MVQHYLYTQQLQQEQSTQKSINDHVGVNIEIPALLDHEHRHSTYLMDCKTKGIVFVAGEIKSGEEKGLLNHILSSKHELSGTFLNKKYTNRDLKCPGFVDLGQPNLLNTPTPVLPTNQITQIKHPRIKIRMKPLKSVNPVVPDKWRMKNPTNARRSKRATTAFGGYPIPEIPRINFEFTHSFKKFIESFCK